MIVNIKYHVKISYKDFTNEFKVVDYDFFARDKNHASQIAKELFFVKTGILPDMKLSIRAIKASSDVRGQVLGYIQNVLPQIYEAINGTNYNHFLNNYTLYEGKNLVFKEEKSYDMTVFGITFKVIYVDNKCELKTDLLVVDYDSKRYVVCNQKDVYIGG